MARFRIPTGRKVGRPPKKHRKTFQKNPISGAHKEKEPNIEQIKPQMISIRRYREIFGSSDEELEVIHSFTRRFHGENTLTAC